MLYKLELMVCYIAAYKCARYTLVYRSTLHTFTHLNTHLHLQLSGKLQKASTVTHN